MKSTTILAGTALALLAAAPLSAQPVQVDASITGYEKTSGVSGNLNSIGSDTLNNLMTLWAEGFKKQYPNVRIQIEGKGSSTAPPALIAGTAQLGPMSRAMKAERDRRVREEVRLQADRDQGRRRRAGGLRQQGQPAREAHAAAGRRDLLQDRASGGGKDITTWGDARPRRRRLGGEADQPLRPQLRLRHLRLLQGARALQGRLQGHGQGAAGLGLGRAGRDRGPVRHRLQRHRLQDLGREGAGAGARRTASRSSAPTPGDVYAGKYPLVALPLRLRQQGAQQAARSAGPRVPRRSCSRRRARRSWSRTATCRCPAQGRRRGARQAEVSGRGVASARRRPLPGASVCSLAESTSPPSTGVASADRRALAGGATRRRAERAPARPPRARRLLRRPRRRAGVVTAGGLAIIASILGILVFIVARGAAARPAGPRSTTAAHAAARRAARAPCSPTSTARTSRRSTPTARVARRAARRRRRGRRARPAAAPAPRRRPAPVARRPRRRPHATLVGGATTDGRRASLAAASTWRRHVRRRRARRRRRAARRPPVPPSTLDPTPSAGRSAPSPRSVGVDGPGVAAAQLADGRLGAGAPRSATENEFTGEVERVRGAARARRRAGRLTALRARPRRSATSSAARASGELLWWRPRRRAAGAAPRSVSAGGAAITALDAPDRRPLAGRRPGERRALASGSRCAQADGSVRAHPRPRLPAATPAAIRAHRAVARATRASSPLDAPAGSASTTRPRDRVLWTGPVAARRGARPSRSPPRATAPSSPAPASSRVLDVDNPHPEVSLESLFGKVWYEGYAQPELRLAVDRRHRRLRAQAHR